MTDSSPVAVEHGVSGFEAQLAPDAEVERDMYEELSAEDIVAIQNMIATYALMIDYREIEPARSVFAEDAVLAFNPPMGPLPERLQGREKIVEFLEESFRHGEEQARDGFGLRHFSMLSQIGIVSGEARARTGMLITQAAPAGEGAASGISVICTGVYWDRFVRNDGNWQIAERRLELDVLALPQVPDPGVTGADRRT